MPLLISSSWPFTFFRTSPRRMPASAAGPLGSTPEDAKNPLEGHATRTYRVRQTARLDQIEPGSREVKWWVSIPDDELLEAAAAGRLRQPAVLEKQVRRMLRDPRAQALVDNFAGQWLMLRNLKSHHPVEGEFPNFDHALRLAFQKETELFFGSVVREDRSILDLLDANYTFVNERLARHYGMPYIYGSHFRRVTLNREERRGLLGQGSILTVTSYPNRTSPVLRGKWILENLLGTPPPPPPPDVPSLRDTDSSGRVLSMRERMAQHRANPVCSTCHALMDPLGLSMENFDAVGRWRTRGESNGPIDAAGALPGGMVTFQGVGGLRDSLLSRPDAFVTTVSEKLLAFALGRAPQFFDGPAVRGIVRTAARNDYRFSSVLMGIVTSAPFQMRQSAPRPAATAAAR